MAFETATKPNTGILDKLLGEEQGYRGNRFADGVSRIRTVPAAVASILKVHRQALREIDANGWLSAEGKQETRTAIGEWARAKIDSLNTVFDSDAQKVLSGLPPVTNSLTPEQQAAYEAKAPRLWTRVKSQLDAGVSLETVVGNSDRDSLQVIEEEIGAYMLARHVSDERMANLQTEAAQALINQHRPTVLTPEEAKRFNERGEIEAGINNVTGAFNWGRDGLRDKSIQHLPAFERGESVTVNE